MDEVWRPVRRSYGLCNAGHFAPSVEGGIACGTMFVGVQAVAAKLEEVMDAAVGGGKTLGMTR